MGLDQTLEKHETVDHTLAIIWKLAAYKGRWQIEMDFRSLKLFFGLLTSLPQSVNGYLANYFHAILAIALR